jgi:hypothetical protein
VRLNDLKVGVAYAWRRGKHGTARRVTIVELPVVPKDATAYQKRRITFPVKSVYADEDGQLIGKPRDEAMLLSELRHFVEPWDSFAEKLKARTAARERENELDRKSRENARAVESDLLVQGFGEVQVSADEDGIYFRGRAAIIQLGKLLGVELPHADLLNDEE